MDEVEHDITKARQKKTKVGSFRINPDGTQEKRKGISSKLLLSPGGPKVIFKPEIEVSLPAPKFCVLSSRKTLRRWCTSG
ncbi:hypothetical protein MC885_008325 [Smutsia gigantea]|nr:hypothetical protein MC885_008325 [Smutsia gigantea]